MCGKALNLYHFLRRSATHILVRIILFSSAINAKELQKNAFGTDNVI
jgi:hypothetical protein